jgi:Ca-activated chloride channel family protein
VAVLAMSFAEPILLTGLILLPLAALAYGALQRRRRRESAAWANPALVPGLVRERPGWRRHLPPLLLLIALGALVVALARPQRSVAAAQRQATVMMVTDVSGSMRANDVQPDRLSAAVDAGHALADKLPDELRLGLVSFSDYAEQTVPPTTERDPVNQALDRLVADGGTAMGDALRRGIESARTPVPNKDGSGSRRLPAVIVLLSDGKNTSGNTRPLDVARQAAALHIPIYAIALGTPGGVIELTDPFSGATQRVAVPPDPSTLKEVARITHGRFFQTAKAADLKSIYANLGTKLSSKQEKREVTVAFAGGGLALLLVGGGLSLAWFGRLP